jgi:hypothetical protein
LWWRISKARRNELEEHHQTNRPLVLDNEIVATSDKELLVKLPAVKSQLQL